MHTRYAVLIGALGLAGAGLGLLAGAVRAALTPAPGAPGAALGLATAGAGFQLAQADERDSGATFEQALAAGVGWAAVLMLVLLAAACAGPLAAAAKRASSAAPPAAES